ncbi:LysR family transcriptional regulator [Vibrio gallaecicus]|uniref:LysR family transcriptional regulator n=1 Tax=Vibrio gallaecicus TaxID=552386 RepID=A0ABV4NGJ5_9VIBR|nr:LysR family transcriptional regulator [Vibrio gallaecicus]MDN3616706.1 LysR family transcriptional regulator [Vibrio gallaecicus]
MLNPLWLHTFKTLVDVGHFTQTAEKLYMTQPGVSQHIKKLEHACNHPLITRENKSFELTEQGRIIYQYAIKIAKDEHALFESLCFDNPYSGQCLLSCSGSLSLLLYPKLLDLQKEHSEMYFHLEAAPNHKVLNDIQQGSIELGIVTHIPSSSLFQNEIIGKEALCLVLPKSYEGQAVTSELLFSVGLICHPDSHHYLSLYFDLCGDEELSKININSLPKAGYINQLHQILVPISKGLGFTVLPESAVRNFPQAENLYIAPPTKKVEEALYLVQKRNRELPHRYNTLIDKIKQVLK